MRLLAAALILAVDLASAQTAQAFRDVAVGAPVRNRDLPTLDGRSAPLLGPARANVFVFFRAGQEHSLAALRQVALLEEELRGKPVRFVAVASDADAKEDVIALVREAGARMPVLVDRGDALYGELGVVLHPSVGIADAGHRLVAYQPFRKVNFQDALRARIRLVLGEIGEAELQAVVDPPSAKTGVNRAHARVKLARSLLAAGAVDAAVESARAAVAMDPAAAEAHAALSEALARAGQCEEASREAGEARRLGPVDGAPPACTPR